MLITLALIATLFAGWRAWRRLRYLLHILQLEGYKTNEFRAWIGARLGDVVLRRSHQVGIVVLLLAVFGHIYDFPVVTTVLVLLAWPLIFISSRRYRSEREKKPLAYTARLQRLLGVAAVLTLLPIVGGAYLGLERGDLPGWLLYLLGFWVADLGVPLWVLLAGYLTKPIENAIHEGYKRQARTTLQQRRNLTVIGITGSYGKTSTKFVIAEVLRQRYHVLATPGSYNTPMGICLVVNNKLRSDHQMLVLEMGMRYRGDIQELCELAPPDIAVVTNVGIAHLETMGSQDAIAEEKGDLVAYQKPGGIAVLNVDDPRVAAMAERATGPVWRVSTDGHPDADLTARDIRYDTDGATFTVTDEEGHTATFRTKLLGKHNVLNILLALAVGRSQGLRLRQMVPAVKRLEPVAHRLALRQEGGITVIDDAFNSNPVGARNAVEILGQFTSGRRIIVTPGMIELGERHEEENRRFGTHIAANADLAILVGEVQTAPIQAGLADAGYPEAQTKIVASLFEAKDFLTTYVQPGDVVLYENDLPDQYDERG